MSSECLLHLVREARLLGQKSKVDRLLPLLLASCEARLEDTIPNGSRPDAAGIREEILQAFGLLLARVGTNHDSTALDFFEIRFNRALAALRFKRLDMDDTRRDRFTEIGSETDEDGTPVDEDNRLAKISDAARNPARQENLLYLKQVLAFIMTMPPGERDAVILCCVRGYKTESDDPDEVTAATLLGITGRAVRKRLKNATTRLKQFNQESTR